MQTAEIALLELELETLEADEEYVKRKDHLTRVRYNQALLRSSIATSESVVKLAKQQLAKAVADNSPERIACNTTTITAEQGKLTAWEKELKRHDDLEAKDTATIVLYDKALAAIQAKYKDAKLRAVLAAQQRESAVPPVVAVSPALVGVLCAAIDPPAYSTEVEPADADHV